MRTIIFGPSVMEDTEENFPEKADEKSLVTAVGILASLFSSAESCKISMT